MVRRDYSIDFMLLFKYGLVIGLYGYTFILAYRVAGLVYIYTYYCIYIILYFFLKMLKIVLIYCKNML